MRRCSSGRWAAAAVSDDLADATVQFQVISQLADPITPFRVISQSANLTDHVTLTRGKPNSGA